jgi:hypothetical protein
MWISKGERPAEPDGVGQLDIKFVFNVLRGNFAAIGCSLDRHASSIHHCANAQR